MKCYNQPVSCVHNLFLEFICLGVVSHCSRFGSLNGCLMYTSRNISRLPWILGVYIYCYCIPICNSFCIYLVVITLNYLRPLAKEGEKGLKKKKGKKIIQGHSNSTLESGITKFCCSHGVQIFGVWIIDMMGRTIIANSEIHTT